MTHVQLLETLKLIRWFQRPSPSPDEVLNTPESHKDLTFRVVVGGEEVALTDTDLHLLGIREPTFFLAIVDQLIKSADPEIRATMFFQLDQFDDNRTESLILDALRQEQDVHARSCGMFALLRHGTRAAVQTLTQLTTDDRVDWAGHQIGEQARSLIVQIELRAGHARRVEPGPPVESPPGAPAPF